MRYLWNAIKPYLTIPTKPTIGFVFCITAVLNALLLYTWFALPDSVLFFSKTSLLGYAIIQILRTFIVLLFPFVFLSNRYSISSKIVFGRNPGLGAFIISFLCGFPVMLIYTTSRNIFIYSSLANNIALPLPAIFTSSTSFSLESMLLTILVSAIFPIFIQELFFRGLIYSLFPPHFRGLKGIILTSLMFAVFMLNPVDFFALFIIGIILGYIRHATDNVLCPMLTQFAMVLCFFLFRNLLPFIDISIIRSHIEIDISIIYISIVVLILSIFSLLPLITNVHRISIHLQLERTNENKPDSTSIKPHLSASLLMGLVIYSGLWAIVLNLN